MPDESADFQGATPSYPPTDLKVAVDKIGGVDYQRIKLDGGGDGVLIPVVAGRNADAASLPVALSSEDVAILNAAATSAKQDTGNTSLSTLAGIVSSAKAAVKSAIGDIADLATLLTNVGALTETAPATDTASSGLNGRLQRIAQRITSLIALLPSALGSGGGLKVDGSGTALPVSLASVPSHAVTNAGTFAVQATSVPSDPFGANADAASATGSISAKLRSIATFLSGTLAVADSAAETSLSTIAAAISATKMKIIGALTPSWTDSTSIVAITTLAKGAVSRTTFSVPSKFGAYVFIFIGRTGTTALDKAIHVRIRRIVNGVTMLAPEAAFDSDIAAAVSGVCAASGNNAGVTTLTLNASTTFIAGSNGEIWLAVLDSTSAPTTASEWVRQSLATSVTAKLLDAPTVNAHNSTSHNVADKANVFKAFVEGGCTYELIIDYGEPTTGNTVVIRADMQTLDSIGVA